MESLRRAESAGGVPTVDIPGFVHLLRDWVVAPSGTDTVRDTARRATQGSPHFLCVTCPGPDRRPVACSTPCIFGDGGAARGGLQGDSGAR